MKNQDELNKYWSNFEVGYVPNGIDILHVEHQIITTCDKCGKSQTAKNWVSDSPFQKWGYGELPEKPYRHVYDDDNPVITQLTTPECDDCRERRELSALIAQIPALKNEVISRQRTALNWFNSTGKNPVEYQITHRSSGFNPEAFDRDGVKIGYTCGKGGWCKDACYLIHK